MIVKNIKNFNILHLLELILINKYLLIIIKYSFFCYEKELE